MSYTQFTQTHPLNSVSQSPAWAQLQESVPNRGKSWQLNVKDNDRIIASCTLIRHKLPKNRCYLYAHRGPIWDIDDEKSFDQLMKQIQKIAQEEKAVFLRIDPQITWESYEELQDQKSFFTKKGFIPAHAQYQPLNSLVIDLTVSEDDILAQMTQNGRRNIKKAQKSEVEITRVFADGPELDEFYRLTEITTARDGFSGHQKAYYQRIINSLGSQTHPENPIASIYSAYYQGEIIASAIMTTYGKTGIYYYGASDNKHRKIMAPYLLQWQAIQDAKAAGCEVYDWLGVAPIPVEITNGSNEGKYLVYLGNEEKVFDTQDQAVNWVKHNHSFIGITQFKTRFGGKSVNYIGAWEYIYDPFTYTLLISIKNIRRLIRKYLKLKI